MENKTETTKQPSEILQAHINRALGDKKANDTDRKAHIEDAIKFAKNNPDAVVRTR